MDVGGEESWEFVRSRFFFLVIRGLVNLGKALKVSEKRVGWVFW